MSTGHRVRFMVAQASAREVQELLKGTWREFLTVGSVRRDQEWVGDIEHVIIPLTEAEVQLGEPDLFGKQAEVGRRIRNRLLERLDQLVAAGTIEKATYEHTDKATGEVEERACWGEKQRRFLFKGLRHEVFLADRDNWGPIVAIRTGPEEFSKLLVYKLNDRGVYKQGGYVDKTRGYLCYADGPQRGEVRACATEAEYLQLCGLPWINPTARDAWVERGVRR